MIIKQKILHLLIANVDIMQEKCMKINYCMFSVAYSAFLWH